MNKCLHVVGAIIAAILSSVQAAEEPLYKWSFDNADDKGYSPSVGVKNKSSQMFKAAQIRPGAGVEASAGCYVGELKDHALCRSLELDAEAFTLDFSFRPDMETASEPRALVSYSWKSWRRGQFQIKLLTDNCLEISFYRPASEDGVSSLVDYKALSRPLKLQAGRMHSFRISCAADGVLEAYMDGKQVVAKNNAPGLKGIWVKPGDNHPVLRLGVDSRNPQKMRHFAKGVFDNVAYYASALGAPDVVADVLENYSGIAPVVFEADGVLQADVLIPDANQRVKTGQFRINTKEEGLLGNWVVAEDKFVKSAATAEMAISDEDIVVVFNCPVPKGMEALRNDADVWRGDGVEFFIRPNIARQEYLQYVANAAGLKWAAKKFLNGGEDNSFKSAFKVDVRDVDGGFEVKLSIPRKEIFDALPREGDVFTVNFARTGATAGGVSTWANVGHALCNPEKFGRVVWGGSKVYFERMLAEAERKCNAFSTDAARAAAKRAIEPLKEAVTRHSGDVRLFAALETMFSNFNQTMITIDLSGRPLIVYQADAPWGNRLEPDGNTKPLNSIRIVAARNSRAWYPFVVKNTTAREFLGQVKVFNKAPGYRFSYERTAGIARRVKVMEAIPSDIGGGALSYDPMTSLPMSSLLRIAPRSLAALWLELDTHDLAAGRNNVVLVIKRARSGFETISIPVEIDVRELDLNSVDADRAAYDRFTSRCLESPEMQKFAARYAGNIVYMNPWKGSFSSQNRDGTWTHPDFAPLDKALDARIEAGVPREKVKLWWFMALENPWNAPTAANGSKAKIGTRTWDEGVRATVLALREHLRRKYAMEPDRYYLYLTDEPNAKDGVDDPELKTKMSKTYYAAKVVKSADSALRTFVNPYSKGAYSTEKFCETLRRLEECIDVIEFYRSKLRPDMIARTKDFRFEYWTYNILGSTVPPSVYRRDMWMNMRDGFRELTPFWHFVDMAGGDGFDPTDSSSKGGRNKTDYGSVYVDFDNAAALPSRRQIAYDLSFEDARLIMLQRKRYAGDKVKSAEIERLVKTAADAGTMEAMEEARSKLLDM